MALIVSTIMLISVDISKFIIENVIFGINLIKDCVKDCRLKIKEKKKEKKIKR